MEGSHDARHHWILSVWPRWQDSLEAAKDTGFLTLDRAVNWLLEYERQQGEEPQRPTTFAD
jgi:hypothetical protein